MIVLGVIFNFFLLDYITAFTHKKKNKRKNEEPPYFYIFIGKIFVHHYVPVHKFAEKMLIMNVQ